MGEWKERKVVIVGAGSVGSTFAYALAQTDITDTIVLLDQNKELMKGKVLDLEHGFPFWPTINPAFAIECSDNCSVHFRCP